MSKKKDIYKIIMIRRRRRRRKRRRRRSNNTNNNNDNNNNEKLYNFMFYFSERVRPITITKQRTTKRSLTKDKEWKPQKKSAAGGLVCKL